MPENPEQTKPAGHRREFLFDCLHLITLVGFAVAQPLLEVLKQGATFFVARDSEAVDILVLGIGLALLLPLPLMLIEGVFALAGRFVRRSLHLLFVAALAALALLPLLKRVDDAGGWIVPAAMVGGAIIAFGYVRLGPIRSLLTALSPAPVLFVAMFFFHPPISKLLGMGTEEEVRVIASDSNTPVVMLVLDEFPITSLVTEDWAIDAELFPNFARLASKSTWFRNASANHNSTELAVPAILTGMMPTEPERLPIEADHPRNLFKLLSGSHRLNVWETQTGLSGSDSNAEFGPAFPFRNRMTSLADDLIVVYAHIVLPAELAVKLPPIETNWGGFRGGDPDDLGTTAEKQTTGAVEKKEKPEVGKSTKPHGAKRSFKSRTDVARGFIESLEASERPTLNFLHILLPHSPWKSLPTGQHYTYKDRRSPGRTKKNVWGEDESLTALAYQRHLLQLGHLDSLLGELIDRLEEQGMYERSLFVLTADHGCCFRPNEPVRGAHGSMTSVRDILHIPFFVKRPYQEEGGVSDRDVQAVDTLPTIADALDIELTWELDGRSAFDSSSPARSEKVIYYRALGTKPLVVPSTMPSDWPPLDRKLELFGSQPGWAGVYAMGSSPESSVAQRANSRRCQPCKRRWKWSTRSASIRWTRKRTPFPR